MVEDVLSFANVASDLKVTNGPIVWVKDFNVVGQLGGIIEDTPLVGDWVHVLDGHSIWIGLLLGLRLGTKHFLQELE